MAYDISMSLTESASQDLFDRIKYGLFNTFFSDYSIKGSLIVLNSYIAGGLFEAHFKPDLIINTANRDKFLTNIFNPEARLAIYFSQSLTGMSPTLTADKASTTKKLFVSELTPKYIKQFVEDTIKLYALAALKELKKDKVDFRFFDIKRID